MDIKLHSGLTGIQPNDVLIGISNCTENAMIRIHSNKYIPPDFKYLDPIRQDKEKWNLFLNKLGSIPFYSKMSLYERNDWLKKNQSSIEYIGDDNCITEIEILQTGSSDLSTKLDNQYIEHLMTGKLFDPKDIEELLPRKLGSRASRHTLFFNKSFWKISVDYKLVSNYTGLIFDINNGKLIQNYTSNQNQEIYILDNIQGKEIGFLVQKFKSFHVEELVKDIYIELHPEETSFEKNLEIIQNHLSGLTAGMLKSLLQKIIRFQSKYIDFFNQKYNSELVLLITMKLLFENNGSFVPDIQRFVTGLESLTKRLGVIAFEDSYIDNPKDIVCLFSSALLAQKVRSWKPSKELIRKWFMTGLELLNNSKAYIYDTILGKQMDKYILDISLTDFELCSSILDELKSFEGDLSMVRYISKHIQTCQTDKRPESMQFYHFIDQHCIPNFVYFCSYDLIKTTNFSDLFTRVFQDITGINPRRISQDWNQFETNDFVCKIRTAQKLTMQTKSMIKESRKIIDNEHYSFTYELSDSWLAGMIGAISVSDKYYCTLKTDDLHQIITIRKPSRSNSEQITHEQEEYAKSVAKKKLHSGILLKNCKLFQNIKNTYVRLSDDDQFMIIKDNEEILWTEFKTMKYEMNIVESIEKSIINAFRYDHIMCIERNAFEELEKILDKTDKTIIYRMLSYLSCYKSEYQMHNLSRDGTGTELSVINEDIGAFQLLLYISMLFPGALHISIPFKFQVGNGPLLWKIIEKIKNRFDSKEDREHKWKEYNIHDLSNRKPWEHQISTVEEMIQNKSRGNFIWIPVGLGKSKIVMMYLKHLIDTNRMPKYILYTLPDSAVNSVIDEIQKYNFPINYIIPLKSIKNKKIPEKFVIEDKIKRLTQPKYSVTQKSCLKPYSINIIEHDHLRKCEQDFVPYMMDCIFIVDEVHKTLNETKRTSSSLNLAHLSKKFIVFTGTPVIDNKIYKLIWWLEQIVDFEVTLNNFWVSANNIVARKITTGVHVNRDEIQAEFNSNELSEYQKYAPTSLGGSNKNTSIKDLQKITEICYQVCNRKMIDETLYFLNQKRGVMLVAKDKDHQQELRQLLISSGIHDQDIFVMTGSESIFMTDENVKMKLIHDYKVVIVPISKPEGYTLTRLSIMISSVYPSNQAKREQIEGRINRIGQSQKDIYYRIIHTGILSFILRNHNSAKSLKDALYDLAKRIEIAQEEIDEFLPPESPDVYQSPQEYTRPLTQEEIDEFLPPESPDVIQSTKEKLNENILKDELKNILKKYDISSITNHMIRKKLELILGINLDSNRYQINNWIVELLKNYEEEEEEDTF